mmetsp:Transcript_4906/g.5661  ORF Transcript_4906/g.5661 Transcript_4906/m.5661 type:complete len:178 (+) Transcript_4906:3-536(+)
MRIRAPILVFYLSSLLANVDAFGIHSYTSCRPLSLTVSGSGIRTASRSSSIARNTFTSSCLYSANEKSLAEMEDEVEQRLDSQGTVEEPLQHTTRAPVKLNQSSQSHSVQEETFKDEDEEAVERQKTVRRLLEEDERQWKEERRRKVLGKYADAKSKEDIQKLNEEEQRKIDKGAWV